MKRLFLVEADTQYDSLFCYELTEVKGKMYEYEREPGSALFNQIDREQFFGNLNALCVTKPVFKSPPIHLKPPTPRGDSVVQFLNDAPDRVSAVTAAASATPLEIAADRLEERVRTSLADQEHAGISEASAGSEVGRG